MFRITRILHMETLSFQMNVNILIILWSYKNVIAFIHIRHQAEILLLVWRFIVVNSVLNLIRKHALSRSGRKSGSIQVSGQYAAAGATS